MDIVKRQSFPTASRKERTRDLFSMLFFCPNGSSAGLTMRRGVAGVGEMSRKRSVQETVVSEQRETHRDLVPAPSLRKKEGFLKI